MDAFEFRTVASIAMAWEGSVMLGTILAKRFAARQLMLCVRAAESLSPVTQLLAQHLCQPAAD